MLVSVQVKVGNKFIELTMNRDSNQVIISTNGCSTRRKITREHEDALFHLLDGQPIEFLLDTAETIVDLNNFPKGIVPFTRVEKESEFDHVTYTSQR